MPHKKAKVLEQLKAASASLPQEDQCTGVPPPDEMAQVISEAANLLKTMPSTIGTARNGRMTNTHGTVGNKKWKTIADSMVDNQGANMPTTKKQQNYEAEPVIDHLYIEEPAVGFPPSGAPIYHDPIYASGSPKRKRRVGSNNTNSISTGMPVGLPEKIAVEEGYEIAEDAMVPDNPDDIEMVRKHLVIERVPERMHIIVVAVDLEDVSANSIELIKCGGEPLGCYAYDCNNDAYFVSCRSYAELGSVGVAYRIRSQGDSEKNNLIALPDEMLEKYLSPVQKKQLRIFRDKYKAPRFRVEFMQSISC